MEGERNCSATTAHNQPKKIKTTNHLEIAYLPQEIIQHILFRLPVKSLLKFRCVSKSWFSLISSPLFVKDHLEFSTENADFNNLKMILTFAEQGPILKQCPVSSLMLETTVESYPSQIQSRGSMILGSCNGMICVQIDSGREIILLNPTTIKSKVLPRSTPPPRWYHSRGFGYSKSEDDYKVICIYCVNVENGLLSSKVNIYSLKSDSWKSIEDFRFGILLGKGSFASGKLHFLALSVENFSRNEFAIYDIVSLDMKSEAYATVEKPNHGEGCSSTSLELLGGCLSFLCHYQGIRLDVWILKEHGANESWTKVVSVPYFDNPHNPLMSSPFYYNPLFILPNGEVALCMKGSVVVYNPKNNCIRHPQLGSFTSICIYFERLVPLQVGDALLPCWSLKMID